jgi:DNA primase
VPVAWSELATIDSTQRFTIADAPRLLRRASSAKLHGWVAEQRLAP